jgi:hypothetical protein
MAYTGNTLSVIAQSIEGSFNVCVYMTTDTVAEVLGSGYVSDGGERGLQVGDIVFAVIGGIPYMLFVGSVSGLSCTLFSIALAIDGNSLSKSNPGVGSGELWNDGGFVVVA